MFFQSLSPLWRPAKLITVRFGSAPSSRDRIDDHRVRVRPWAVAITRPAVGACPTVKPVCVLEDALLDMTERGDIVLDPIHRLGIDAHRCRKDRPTLPRCRA